jgi:hypothetical protein
MLRFFAVARLTLNTDPYFKDHVLGIAIIFKIRFYTPRSNKNTAYRHSCQWATGGFLHDAFQDIQDLGFGVGMTAADARAVAVDFIPSGFGAKVGKPEGKGFALVGPDGINPAAVFKKQASAVIGFPDALFIFPRIKKGLDHC